MSDHFLRNYLYILWIAVREGSSNIAALLDVGGVTQNPDTAGGRWLQIIIKLLQLSLNYAICHNYLTNKL